MTGWLVLGVLAAVFLLYAADRVVKAFLRARRLRQMSERLTAATVRADEQQAKRAAAASAAAQASAALTSVMPAINHPLTVSGRADQDEEPAE
jgi:hypothetical protein